MKSLLQRGLKDLKEGKSGEALQVANDILEQEKDNVSALYLKAMSLLSENELDSALKNIDRAIELQRQQPNLRFAKAQILIKMGEVPSAVVALENCLRLDQKHKAGLRLLGEILLKGGNYQKAFKVYTAGFRVSRGKDPEMLFGLASSALNIGKVSPALKLIERALETNPGNVEYITLKAEILCKMRAPGKGIQLFREILKQRPNNIQALVKLGDQLHQTEDQNESIDCFDRALEINQKLPIAQVLSAAGIVISASLDRHEEARQRLNAFLDSPARAFHEIKAAYWIPFLGMPLEAEQKSWKKIEARINQVNSGLERKPLVHLKSARDRIRVGYISPNFGNHGIGHVTSELYGLHDREKFEVFVYPTLERQHDTSVYKQKIADSADHYKPLGKFGAGEVARKIYDDGIDILIDLNGYMGETKIIETFSLRPAPVQMYWLGHGGALGLPYYDYVIGDATVTPEEHEDRYVEKILRLPNCFAPAAPYEIAEECPTRGEEGLKPDGFVFCAFNNPGKVSKEVFDAWMEILRQVPDSQLWLSRGRSPMVADNLRRFAKEADIDPTRLVFAERIEDKSIHFARHQLADLFLDTFSVNAATTTLDALWGGLPVLTRPNEHFCSRIAASMVKTAGLEDLIVGSTEDYIKKAVELANDPAQIAALKARTAEAKRSSPLFDPKIFIQGLEKALIAAWERHRKGEDPASMTIDG